MAGKAEQIGRRIVTTRDLLCTSKEFKHRRPVETTPPWANLFFDKQIDAFESG